MTKQIFILTLLLGLIACTSAQSREEFPPKWANKLPKSKNKVYAVGYGKSANQSVAYEKARTNAFTELAEILGPTTVILKEVSKESNGNIKSEETKTEITLSDVSIIEKASQQTDEGLYEAYILVSYNKKKLKKEISKNIETN
ncbi:MAG TPA: LPP20 family lipoprotein [Salinivirgaceae bacterium]|nr:LPP20 family lipoprotein [Salinivirgaceae bacterium]HQA76073.1 LPP20 family lipoprotein [Salinivirgaceae bacterium]